MQPVPAARQGVVAAPAYRLLTDSKGRPQRPRTRRKGGRIMMRKSDEHIHQAVLRELRWDSRVGETEVGVEVDQGVVTLTGTVEAHVGFRGLTTQKMT